MERLFLTITILLLTANAARCQHVEQPTDTVQIQFGAGDHRLTPAARKQLDRLAIRLRGDTLLGVRILGATKDLCPTCDERLFDRMNGVARYLVRQGVQADHIGSRMWFDRETNRLLLEVGRWEKIEPMPAPHPNLARPKKQR